MVGRSGHLTVCLKFLIHRDTSIFNAHSFYVTKFEAVCYVATDTWNASSTLFLKDDGNKYMLVYHSTSKSDIPIQVISLRDEHNIASFRQELHSETWQGCIE